MVLLRLSCGQRSPPSQLHRPARRDLPPVVKLQSLKPRLGTIPGRLQMASAIQTDRLRGRAAVQRRSRWLDQHPLCVQCEAEDTVTAATVPDHRIPLWAAGADDERNLQSLCAPHHDAKSACEARMRAAGGWLSTPCSCGQHKNASPAHV